MVHAQSLPGGGHHGHKHPGKPDQPPTQSIPEGNGGGSGSAQVPVPPMPSPEPSSPCHGPCSEGQKIYGIANVNARVGNGYSYYSKQGECVDGYRSQEKVVCLYEYGGTFYGNEQQETHITRENGVLVGVADAHIKRETGWKKIYFANTDYQIQGDDTATIIGRVSNKDYEYEDHLSDFASFDIASAGVQAAVANSCDQIAASLGYKKVSE